MSRRTALLLLGGLLASVALVVMVSLEDQRVSDGETAGYTIPRPQERAAPSTVRPVHRALHTLGEDCTTAAGPEQVAATESAVKVILGFARRHPDVRFPVHEEVGTVPSLLYVTRESVRSCAPWFVGRIERLIPAEYLPGTAG